MTNCRPTTDPKFLALLKSWFEKTPEILVLIRLRCGGGARDFEFYSSYEALFDRINNLPHGASVTAFKQPQLLLRGVVSDHFITKCLEQIPNGAEYLMVETVQTVAGKMSWFHNGSGVSHAELRDDLQESQGVHVAVGLHPPVLDDTDEVIYAVVPDADGTVRAGPY